LLSESDGKTAQLKLNSVKRERIDVWIDTTMNVAMIVGGAFKLVSSGNQQRVVPVPTTLSLSSPYSRVGFKLVSSGNQQRVVPTTLSLSLSLSPYSRVADHAAGDHARRRVVSMASSSSSSSSSGGGGSGLLDRPLTPKKDTVRKRPPIYKVLLHNDVGIDMDRCAAARPHEPPCLTRATRFARSPVRSFAGL
jgi:hypothetical protein